MFSLKSIRGLNSCLGKRAELESSNYSNSFLNNIRFLKSLLQFSTFNLQHVDSIQVDRRGLHSLASLL